MHPRELGARAAPSPLLLLSAVAAAACLLPAAGAFSYSRSLHDVEQEVEKDPDIYPETRTSEFGGQRVQQDRYVAIKESPKSYVSLPRGHRVELRCEVDGSPPPRIYWVMGENPGKQVKRLEHESITDVPYNAIAREESKLVIDCLAPQDEGLVHCVGVSGDKMVISQPTVLKVEGGTNGTLAGGRGDCPDEQRAPVITRHRPLYFSEMGSTVVLPCEASGSPRPHVRWYNSEGNHIADPRFAVQPSGDLVISNIVWEDMDGYKCLAKSALGETEAVTFLYPAKVRNHHVFKATLNIFSLFKRFFRKTMRF